MPYKTAKAQPHHGWGDGQTNIGLTSVISPLSGGGGGCMVFGTPGTRPPSSSWEQHNLPQAYTMLASLQNYPPPPSTTNPTRGWEGGADKRPRDKEEAKNGLSRNKGLRKGERTHCTNQNQQHNRDFVYYSLAKALKNCQKKVKVCRGPKALARSKRPHQQAHKRESQGRCIQGFP